MQSVGNPWLWAGFLVLIVALLSIDLGILHKKDRAIAAREAMSWVVVWMALAVSFGGFVLVFATFRIPGHLQHRVLYWGILTALVLRGAMILAGTALLQRFHWLLYVFGAFLLFTGVKLLFAKEEEESPEQSLAFRALRRVLPATPNLHGNRFFVVADGRRVATPLFLCLALIEISDVVFALDSVPAIFGVTLDPFIVFTSNIFAILGLRSLYFAIASLIGRFAYLKVGLSFVLIFIGLKMTIAPWVAIGSFTSLAVVAGLLGSAVVFSLAKTRRRGNARGDRRSSNDG